MKRSKESIRKRREELRRESSMLKVLIRGAVVVVAVIAVFTFILAIDAVKQKENRLEDTGRDALVISIECSGYMEE